MKAQQLQAENEALQAQIAGLKFHLEEANKKQDMFLQTLHAYKERVTTLEDEVRLLKLNNQARTRYSDTDRNY